MSRKLKLLLNENIGVEVFKELLNRGYDVKSVIFECRGAEDMNVIEKILGISAFLASKVTQNRL